MVRVALLHFKGFEDYTVGLANGLANYAEVILIHPNQLSAAHQQALDDRIQRLPFWLPRLRDPRSLLMLRQVFALIRAVEPDILHVQEANNFWYDCALRFSSLPPLVTTVHDVMRHPGDRDLKFGTEYTRRIAYYRSQHLIVHTQASQQSLVQQFQVPHHRISVRPHGELGSLYQQFAHQTSVSRDPYTLLFFGRIWPYKGLQYLLAALPLVRQHIPQVKLIIAGRGEAIQQYFPQGYNAEQYEIRHEFIPFEAVASLFQQSTAVVLPYIEASQSGVAPIAYAIGTPVIASNVGGLGEMIRHAEDGLLVPAADSQALAAAIIRLLQDPSLQDRLRRAALERCQADLSWSKIAAQTVETYRQVIESARH